MVPSGDRSFRKKSESSTRRSNHRASTESADSAPRWVETENGEIGRKTRRGNWVRVNPMRNGVGTVLRATKKIELVEVAVKRYRDWCGSNLRRRSAKVASL